MKDAISIPPNIGTSPTWTFVSYGVLLTIFLGVLSPLTFGITPAILGMISVLALGLKDKIWIKPDWSLVFWSVGISALCFASSLWSITPDATVSRATKISTLLFLSLPVFTLLKSLPEQNRQNLRRWFPVISTLMATLLVVELYFDFPLYRMLADKGDERINIHILNKYASVLIILMPISLIWALQTKQLSLATLLVILTCCVLFKTESQAAQLGGVFLILAPLILLFLSRSAIPLTFLMILFLLVFMPFISPIAFDAFSDILYQKGSLMQHASMSARLENYDFISRRIIENPLHGFGMDCTRSMIFDTDQKFFKTNTINHPHNTPLQIWIEFGAIGIVLFGGFLIFIFRRLQRSVGKTRYVAYTTLCIAMIFLMVSWSMWSSWLVGLLIIVSALQPLAKEDMHSPLTS